MHTIDQINEHLITLMSRIMQNELLPVLYREDVCSARHEAAAKAYDACLAVIVDAHGGEDCTPGHCDPDLWEVYHNVYKSQHGVRPRGSVTLAEVKAFLGKEAAS